MPGRSILRYTCALAAVATCSAAQDTQTTPQPAPPATTVAVTGCVQPDEGGRGFLLRTAAPGAGQGAATGTSATGEAPSGPVTGQTPTGATATEAAAPTPAVGTPPASANPASPAYNQPVPDRPNVASADTTVQTGATIYRLAALAGVNLREHAGHTVEIRGTVAAATANGQGGYAGLQGPTARSHEPEAKQPNASAVGTAGRGTGSSAPASAAAPVPTLTVSTIRHVGPSCAP